MKKQLFCIMIAAVTLSSMAAPSFALIKGEARSIQTNNVSDVQTATAGAFTGSTPLVQYLYGQFSANPSTLSIPVTLFTNQGTEQRFDELGRAAIEAYIQNGLTDYVVDFQYNYTSGDPNITMNIIYHNQDASSRQAQAQALDQKANEIIAATIKPEMTLRQKAQALNNYVAQNIRYDFKGFQEFQAGKNVYHLQTAYAGIVGGQAICQGFARSYKLLCDKAGIPCVVIFGTTKQYGTTHAWNRIQLDGKWETVDTSNPALAINHVGSFCIPAETVNATLAPDATKTLMAETASIYLS